MAWTEDQLIAALDRLPAEPLPAGMIEKTMRQIRREPRRRSSFLGVALPAFGLAFVTGVLVLLAWLAGSLDPLWLLSLKLDLQFFWLSLEASWPWLPRLIIPVLALSVTALLLFLALLSERLHWASTLRQNAA
jgi:hypothetical protein